MGVLKVVAAVGAAAMTAVGASVAVLGGQAAAVSDVAGPCTVTLSTPAGTAAVGTLDAGQMDLARTAVGVVKGRALPIQAADIVLATAWVESTLHNYKSATDHDSLGVLQQRPSMGWGTPAQVTDPVYAYGTFLDRMVAIPGWQTREPGSVAQLVQRSGRPDRYRLEGLPVAVPLAASLWGSAAAIAAPITSTTSTGATSTTSVGPGVTCQAGAALSAVNVPGNASPLAKIALARAHSVLGAPYCYDAGNATGPTAGTDCPAGQVGFDCSGLTLYAWAGAGITLPHFSGAQAQMGTKVALNQISPGDLVFLANAAQGNHHVAMIWSVDAGSSAGTGEIIEASDYGVPLHIRRWAGSAEPEVVPYAVHLA